VNWLTGSIDLALGLIQLGFAKPLSIRYNTWTTALRTRHPNFNPPPTPEWRARNTRIMTVLFRVIGAFFLVMGVLYLLPLFVKSPHP
jgi:hypothetical protein